MDQQIPLNHEASAGDTHKQTTTSLPPEVVQCLENARFLHLATCTDNIPHVSLMNYTYLPSSPYSVAGAPVIVMTTNPASKKMNNIVANPNVSLLVHDWVSHRPNPANTQRRLSGGAGADGSENGGGGGPGRMSPEPPRSSLAELLFNLNTSALSSISATINGHARLVEQGTPEERYYRDLHLANNTFEGEAGGADLQRQLFGAMGRRESVVEGSREVEVNDGGRNCFVAGEEVRVVVVAIHDVRIADWKGTVRDWVLVQPGEGEHGNGQQQNGLANGVR